MADEKNQNDQVQDLLARLRSQMSQLDEMFGFGDTKTPTEEEPDTPAVAEETPSSEEEPFLAEEILEEPEGAEAEAEEESEEANEEPEAEAEEEPEEANEQPEAEAEEEPEEANEQPDNEEAPAEDVEAYVGENAQSDGLSSVQAAAEEPLQMDLFAEIDSLLDGVDVSEDTDAPSEFSAKTEDIAPTDVSSLSFDEEDEIPVFSKDNIPLHIHKESIVAEYPEEELQRAPEEETDTAFVTEVPAPSEDPLREKTESHASCFVPNAAVPEEEAAPATALSPFSPERRFDPSKYDAMLATYERRKAEALEVKREPELPLDPKPHEIPVTPILMPRTTAFALPTELYDTEEDADSGESLAEELFEPFSEELDEEPVEDAFAMPDDLPEEPPTEKEAPLPEKTPAPQPNKAEPEQPAHVRVVLAQGELSDHERDSRSHVSTGRVHLAPTAYRAIDERGQGKSRYTAEDDDEEDFMDGLPSGIRDSLVGFPLGRPNRAQAWNVDADEVQKSKKKRKTYRFSEELEGMHDEEDAAPGYVRHHLKETLRQTRARLIVIAVLSFVLLLLENISLVQGFVPPDFVEVQTAGIIDALLLAGVAIAAWPRLSVGIKGAFHGRVLPESILFLQTLLAFVHAVVLGVLGEPTLYLSFVPALGLSILYSFRVLRCETNLRTFEKSHTAGDKLILSPASKRDIYPTASGKKADTGTEKLYRMQKASAVRGFSERSSKVCEDEWLNLGILLSSLLVGGACFLLAYFVIHSTPATAIRAALFGCFLSSPLAMLGVHVYSMHRADRAAGADSAIAGEATVREAVAMKAVAFEDIEAAPSSGVVLSGIRVHCDDPTAVFKYLTALYGHIGGPLCGRFSGMYGDKNAPPKANVELVGATRDGISAIIDGAEIVVGNGQYMTVSGITPAYDPEDERVLSDGRSGVLYVSVNGMVCMKFYMEHRISLTFEKSVMHLHRLGISTILRTYDPNFNEKTVARSAALRECHTQVIGKTVEQRNDFYAEQADGGIVTSKNSTKLLRLFLLCFRTHRMLRFGRVYKLIAAVLGTSVSVALCVLGIFAFLPSVYLALYHLVLLALYMLVVTVGIRLPEISEGK